MKRKPVNRQGLFMLLFGVVVVVSLVIFTNVTEPSTPTVEPTQKPTPVGFVMDLPPRLAGADEPVMHTVHYLCFNDGGTPASASFGLGPKAILVSCQFDEGNAPYVFKVEPWDKTPFDGYLFENNGGQLSVWIR